MLETTNRDVRIIVRDARDKIQDAKNNGEEVEDKLKEV
jgi:transcriptional regulator